jgi:hypothetical protein
MDVKIQRVCDNNLGTELKLGKSENISKFSFWKPENFDM